MCVKSLFSETLVTLQLDVFWSFIGSMFLINTPVHICCTGQVISQSVMSAVLLKVAQDQMKCRLWGGKKGKVLSVCVDRWEKSTHAA